jgi:uncharacterized protein YjiS (DUF1127 family)
MSRTSNPVAGPCRTAPSGFWLSQLAQDIAAHARGLWATYWDYQARRATVLMLEALDDRMLRDIGLRRSEILPYVHGTPNDRRRPYDPAWHSPPAAHKASKRGDRP